MAYQTALLQPRWFGCCTAASSGRLACTGCLTGACCLPNKAHCFLSLPSSCKSELKSDLESEPMGTYLYNCNRPDSSLMSLLRQAIVLIPLVGYHCMAEAYCNDASQVWNEADAEEEVLAMVVRTGLRCVNSRFVCEPQQQYSFTREWLD